MASRRAYSLPVSRRVGLFSNVKPEMYLDVLSSSAGSTCGHVQLNDCSSPYCRAPPEVLANEKL
jgi:hypothetical protein